MRLFIFVAIVLVSLFSLTSTREVSRELRYAPQQGCQTLLHYGAVGEYEDLLEGRTPSSKVCGWSTQTQLKQLIRDGHQKMVVVGHGRQSGDDTLIGGEVTYEMLRTAAAMTKKELAAFSCRSSFFGARKVISEKPYPEKGILVWVNQGESLLGDSTWAWQQAYGTR